MAGRRNVDVDESRSAAIAALRALLEHLEAEDREAAEAAIQPMPEPVATGKNPLLLTVADAMSVLQIGRTSVYRLFESGQLSWVQVGAHRRVTSAEIDRFVSVNTHGGSG